jgi:Tol biopolymer transport system component
MALKIALKKRAIRVNMESSVSGARIARCPLRLQGTALLGAVLAWGCNSEFPNPFTATHSTVPPGTSAAIVFVSTRDTGPRGPRELYSLGADGGGLARLTVCIAQASTCDIVEAAPAPDRRRLALRRLAGGGTEGPSLFVVDLERGGQGEVPSGPGLTGVDWSPVSDNVLVYSGPGEGGIEDLFRSDATPQNSPGSSQNPFNVLNLTRTQGIRERRPRIDPSGTIAVFERIGETGKGQVWIFRTGTQMDRVTSGGPGSETLAGTPYIVGSDADPDYSPDGRSIVFRRLTGTGLGGLGAWDVLTVRTDGSGLTAVASGPMFRGAPDWGARGIVFAEVDSAGVAHLVVVQPDGSGRRTLMSGRAGGFDFPRWLP